MKNHFLFAYAGNKRNEVEEIYKNINFKNIDTIIEPFCGSCSLSYYIWTLNKDKNFKYILNDSDKNLICLLKLIFEKKYKEIEDEVNKIRLDILSYEKDQIEAKKIYINYVKKDDIYAYVFKNKYCNMRPGMFPTTKPNIFNKIYNIEKSPIFDFLMNANIDFYNIDGNDIIKNNNNKSCFIFLDPPYIASCNEFYKSDSNENTSNIYEYLYYSKLKNFKSKILICHENNWLFKILFKDYLKNSIEYYKKYEIGKKKETTHICITNY